MRGRSTASTNDAPKVFLNADVLFAGSAQPTKFGVSHVLLRLGQYTILDCIVSEQAVVEAERNLRTKAPSTLATFQSLIDLCVRVVPDPHPDEVVRYRHFADPKDAPILTAALSLTVRCGCSPSTFATTGRLLS